MMRSVVSYLLFLVLLVAAIFLAGCAGQPPFEQEPNLIDGEPAPLTVEVLKNATYKSEFVKAGQAQLKDGVYEEQAAPDSASKNTLMLTEHVAFGDVNGDPTADAAVVLAASGGGSGTFYTLAIVINRMGNPFHFHTASLGDRIKVEAVEIEDGVITVRMMVHGEGDAMCCPTQAEVRRYNLGFGVLRLIERTTPAGRLTEEALRNATYQHEFPKDGHAQLQDGKYEEAIEGSASKIHIALMDVVALGDLNGDGIWDAAVVLEASGGGSGTFRSLEAVINEEGAPVHVASALLGDRVKIEEIIVADQYIRVQMVTHGEGDGMCCPTLRVVQLYQLTEDGLELRHQEEKGRVGDSE
ncbi:MAG: hypothetical protein F4X83_09870 [Chloroflexi bacterium]|nr:hypothetical protein [Chloroflexota bacterium]